MQVSRSVVPTASRGVLVRVILGCGFGVLVGCSKGSSSPAAAAPPPPLAQATYIGSARCGTCHGPDIPAAFEPTYHDDWLASAHGRAGNTTPSEQSIVADQDQNGSSDFVDGLDLGTLPEWSAFTRAGGAAGDLAPVLSFDAAQAEYQVRIDGRVFAVDAVLGAGRHQQTWLTWLGSSRHVLPLKFDVDRLAFDPLMVEAWYTWRDQDSDGFYTAGEVITGFRYSAPGSSPAGSPRTLDSFERRCAGCHLTGITALTRNGAGEFQVQYEEDGVGCEACHGPGSLHEASAGKSPIASGIVDPGELSRSGQRDLCMSCHSRGQSAGGVGGSKVEWPWHPADRAFLPGDTLAAFFSLQADPREPIHVLQGNALHQGGAASSYGTWNHDCHDCHSAHNTLNRADVRMAVRTGSSGFQYTWYTSKSGAPGSGGLLGDATDGVYEDVCEVCHTQTRYFRNDGSAPGGAHHDGQDCTQCHTHESGFLATAGTSTGGLDCAQCHGDLVAAMAPGAGGFLHEVTDTTPNYSLDPLGEACLNCHVDHDLFTPASGYSQKGTNLRASILTVPTVLADARDSDFDPEDGGICISCHQVSLPKSAPRPDGSTQTPPIPFLGALTAQIASYATGTHSYVVASAFTDGDTFQADCSKCHDDDLVPKSDVGAQVGTFAFGLHRSAHVDLLASLGATAPVEEQFCERCHSRPGNPIGGTRKATAGFDWYGVARMSARAEGVWGELQNAARHPVEATTGVHDALEDTSPGWNPRGNRHVECEDCHNSHAPARSRAFTFDGTFLQPKVPTNRTQGTPLVNVWGVDATWPGNWTAPNGNRDFRYDRKADYEWQVCLKCHSDYSWLGNPPAGSTDQALEFNPNNASYHAVIGSSKVTYPPNTSFVAPWTRNSPMACSDCHTSDDPASAQGPHGSAHQDILAGAFNVNTGQTGTQDHLCFKCHDWRVYGRGGGAGQSSTGFAGEGKNLHTYHAKEEHYTGRRDSTCFDCHAAVPHGWQRRAMLIVAEDPAPYNNGNAGNVAADISKWPSSGNWRESNCSNAKCH